MVATSLSPGFLCSDPCGRCVFARSSQEPFHFVVYLRWAQRGPGIGRNKIADKAARSRSRSEFVRFSATPLPFGDVLIVTLARQLIAPVLPVEEHVAFAGAVRRLSFGVLVRIGCRVKAHVSSGGSCAGQDQLWASPTRWAWGGRKSWLLVALVFFVTHCTIPFSTLMRALPSSCATRDSLSLLSYLVQSMDRLYSSRCSTAIPVPRTTHSSGSSATWHGTPVTLVKYASMLRK